MSSVQGVNVDTATKCEHYNTDRDIIAIKFSCCLIYYSCYKCHQVIADHPAQVWNSDDFDNQAILCGICEKELTISTYLESDHTCPACGSEFNPKCQNHYGLYFDM